MERRTSRQHDEADLTIAGIGFLAILAAFATIGQVVAEAVLPAGSSAGTVCRWGAAGIGLICGGVWLVRRLTR